MKNVLAAPLAGLMLIAAMSLGACNTVRGVGQDAEAAGGAVAGAATETQRDLNDGNPATP